MPTSLCRALLVLDVLYCMLAVAEDRLPGWHMFEAVERVEPELHDRDGRVVDISAYLPRDARIIDHRELAEVATFICKKERARAPFLFEEHVRGVRVEIGPSDCVVHATR